MNQLKNSLHELAIFQNFELLIESKSGIDRLRELILSLAVKGELNNREGSNSVLTFNLNTLRLEEDRLWGHQFIEESPPNWARLPLAKLGSWGSGGTPSRGNKEYYGGNIPWLIIGDLNDGLIKSASNSITQKGLQESSAIKVPIGAVLIAMYGSIGKSGISGIECATNQAIAHCIPDREIITTKYLFYLIRAMRPKLLARGRGLAQQNISQTILKHLMVAVPPLEEQELIISKIEELMKYCNDLESAINLRNQVSATARNSAVNAISTARNPKELRFAWERIQSNWEVIAGTPESIESLRELILDVLFKPKKIDEWEVRSFGDLLTISNGDRSKNYPSKEFRVSAGIPFVNAGHLKDGRVDLSEMDYISREKYESLSGGKFQDGDILFCLRGSLGKSALVRNFGEGTIASSLAIFRVGVEIDAEYLLWFLQSGMARLQIKRFDNGTAQPNLAAKSVLKFEIPLPKLSEQKSIVNKVAELMKICDQLQQKLIQKEEIAEKFARSVVSASA